MFAEASAMKKCTAFLNTILTVFLASTISCAEAANKQSIQEAILGQGSFTQVELIEMDLNQDNIVDVTDLVALILQQSQQVSFATSSSEMDETTSTHYIIVDYTGSNSGVLNYTLGGTATLNEDYTDLTSSSAPIINSKAIIKLAAQVDTIFEANENIVLTLLPNNDYQLGAQRTHTVILNDNPNESQANYLFIIGSHVPG
ncbi:MAG: hypothetical protein KAJ63_10770, partial [Methyloprofundus sp.]|nr:hypothetical protein [Methyloprofundus sp.]